MGRIAIRHSNDITRVRTGDRPSPQWVSQNQSALELETIRGQYFPTSDETLQLLEIQIAPDAYLSPHAHTTAEIMYVLRGELRFGAQICVSGSAIFIDQDTLYGVHAGPEGATFLNFRGDPSAQYLSKEKFLATHYEDDATGKVQ
jgi:quercetin dioxygenase-like cupin family protein